VTLVEDIVVRNLGRAEYLPTWQAMRKFTRGRHDSTADELWMVEHPPV
jgi:lipoyl(octanoyl) transferase